MLPLHTACICSERFSFQILTPNIPIPRSKQTTTFIATILTDYDRRGDLYFMFRAFIGGDAETAKLHCIHMEEIEKPGDKVFKAIYFQNDPLEWFDV